MLIRRGSTYLHRLTVEDVAQIVEQELVVERIRMVQIVVSTMGHVALFGGLRLVEVLHGNDGDAGRSIGIVVRLKCVDDALANR